MSKKSRKRNRNILKMLGALGVGLTLANRGKGMEDSNINIDSGRGGKSSSAMARAAANTPTPTSVYQDDIMRGGSGVKFMPKRNPKSIRVPGDSYSILGSLGFKKGGRVGTGAAKKGFGKAMKKGGKK
jgi:hypothetical protein